MPESPIARLQRYDHERDGLPGEHWFTLAAALWLMTRGRGSALERIAAVAAGAALMTRAIKGRDGLADLLARWRRRRVAARLGRRRPYARYLDVATPWPHEQRVRVPAITQPLDDQLSSP